MKDGVLSCGQLMSIPWALSVFLPIDAPSGHGALRAKSSVRVSRRRACAVQYLAEKHAPQQSASPLIADVLLAYGTEHLPYTKTAKQTSYGISDLAAWWGDRTIDDINARTCRAYAAKKKSSWARRNLIVLRAAIGYWHKHVNRLPSIPELVLPPPEPRREWALTKGEAAKLLSAAR